MSSECNLLDLPWEDVLYAHLFPYLCTPELFRLRAASHQAHHCITQYFTCSRQINTTRLGPKFSASSFSNLTKNATCLRRLVLRNSKNWLNDGILSPVLEANPKITSLDLTNCTTISNRALQIAAFSCHDLTELRVGDCPWLSADTVALLATNCVGLRYVDLSGCWEVNDAAVTALAKVCTNLRYLSVAKVYGLTDQCISDVAMHCKQLTHLDIRGCWRVTDDSLRLLGEYCPSLRGLQVRDCRDVTEASLARIRIKDIRVDVPQTRYQVNRDYELFLDRLKLQI